MQGAIRTSLIGLYVWFIPSITLGQADPDKALIEQARTHMERGQEFYSQGEFNKAAEEFGSAYAAQPFSAFLYNAAIARERERQYTKAAALFEKYLSEEPNAPDASHVKQRIELLRVAAGQTHKAGEADAMEQHSSSFKSLVSVRTNPKGAKVSLRSAGKVIAIGQSPSAHTLEQGQYTVFIEHPKYHPVEIPVSVSPGKVYILIAEMSQGEFLGTLNVITRNPGADVFIDDLGAGSVGKTPYLAVLPAGRHQVWLKKPGFAGLATNAKVIAGEQNTLRAAMVRVPYGKLSINANVYGADVYVDDKPVGKAPYTGKLSTGTHTVRVEADEKKDWEGKVEIYKGRVTPINLHLHDSVSRASAWTFAIMSAAFVGGGIALGLLANGTEDSLKRDQARGVLTTDDSRYLKGKILAIGADVSFGVGAIMGLLAVYNFLKDPSPDSEARISKPQDWAFAPYLDPNGAGLRLGRQF
ncbi:MAG: PEGA domain-containing protein [Myxococcales bacterium]|nr:PEGA domain-containing protein [Myxococcales bacterium]MCB9707521.1 PEGA domain-containing protein [Myxococcales bacterium]